MAIKQVIKFDEICDAKMNMLDQLKENQQNKRNTNHEYAK